MVESPPDSTMEVAPDALAFPEPNEKAQPPAGAPAEAGRLQQVLGPDRLRDVVVDQLTPTAPWAPLRWSEA